MHVIKHYTRVEFAGARGLIITRRIDYSVIHVAQFMTAVLSSVVTVVIIHTAEGNQGNKLYQTIKLRLKIFQSQTKKRVASYIFVFVVTGIFSKFFLSLSPSHAHIHTHTHTHMLAPPTDCH